MKRLSVVVLAVMLAALTRGAIAAAPGMQVPILYNDHHVNAAPDLLTRGRVLAALVRDGTVLIPLRSMFEQMGATVTYDASTRGVTVSKAGSTIHLTVGKPEVVINGESRPLDVAPMMYQGVVMVPVRVISESMGAYVQWVPDQHVVVVRYLPATPPPPPATPEPTAAPTIAPTPTPVPAATPRDDRFIAGDYLISPRIYDEFSPGNSGNGSWAVRGAWENSKAFLPFMLEAAWQQYSYAHNGSPGTLNAPCDGFGGHAKPGAPGCVTIIGGGNTLNIAPFTARDSDFDVRAGMRLLKIRAYMVFTYMWKSSSYGYPQLSGFGEGFEKLPDLDQPLSFFGSWIYYPKVSGKIHTGLPPSDFNLQYIVTTYQIGVTYVIGASPVFLEAGWGGESWVNRQNAPGNRTYSGPFAGLGINF